jgi:hypothetical protein
MLSLLSCTSTKSTLKNIDDSILKPKIINDKFDITEYSNNKLYGYNKDYPINIGFDKEKDAIKNIYYFFNALKSENNEEVIYQLKETCCPFPTTKTAIGAGTLDIYEVTFKTSGKKLLLYFNIYEKGKILCPDGFKIK